MFNLDSSFYGERQKAKNRDGCCQLCGATSKKEILTIHHTLFPSDSYNGQKRKKSKEKKKVPIYKISRRDTTKFLIVLCKFCHEWYHQYFNDKEIPFNTGKNEEFCRLCGREEFNHKLRLFDYAVPRTQKKIPICEICLDAALNHNPRLQGGGWYR